MKWQVRGLIMGLVALGAGMSGAWAEHHKTKAVSVLKATAGNSVSGTVTFTQQSGGVMIEAKVSGLKPNSKHGFHIHQFGDTSSPDGKSTGGHYNPAGHDHAKPDAVKRHVGDLGNLESDGKGNATYKRLDKVVQLSGEHTVVGRGITIHADPDSFVQPTGGAGARIAVGAIGLAKSE
jgi:Cu-Zn family superoxide dismutase